MTDNLERKLAELPKDPGVYFHKNSAGEIIYVGKAAILRNRVRQYFQASRYRDPKTEALVAEIADIDWMVVESELEALFLEAEMVRRYMPAYNILLRDDKAMGYIRIDISSDHPTVSTTRRPLDDGARYFGPYLSMYSVSQALRLLRRIFPYATRRSVGQKRVSLHYHLGMDPGLEQGKTSLEEYRSNLRSLIAVIEGRRSDVLKSIEKDMKMAAKDHDFERAAMLRNRLQNLQNLGKQAIFSDKEFLDISKDQALVQLQTLLCLPEPPRRIEGYDISHMSGKNVVASMVVFTNGVSNRTEYRKFKTSERNDDYGNMKETLLRRLSDKNRKAWGSPDLILIDGGAGQLASAISALKERAVSCPIISVAKREEEMIIHKTDSGIKTDYLDQLITSPIEGVEVVLNGGIYTINLHVGQSNAGAHSKNLRGGLTKSPFIDTVKLIQRVRDESHRFAISYHNTLKVKSQSKSLLDDIPGVGPTTRKKLIRAFGSLRGVTKASQEELSGVVGPKLAGVIINYVKTESVDS